MNKEKLISLLPRETSEEKAIAENFASYIIRLEVEKDKAGKIKNAWMKGRTEDQMADLFKRVAKDGLVFDGKHISLQPTGVSYDYVAYKNKMLLAYPESKIDMALVYEGDDFNVSKESGSVIYHHNIASPFVRDTKNIIGAYCVIINKRGEFITLLDKAELTKHRKVAKTDFIWNQWFAEMALKTVIKKAVKQHFDDVYINIEEADNENYDLNLPLNLDLKYKQEIEKIKTIEELAIYYNANKGVGAEFDKMVSLKKQELSAK
jgi:hypothetical protein